jgi:hypothetical protein
MSLRGDPSVVFAASSRPKPEKHRNSLPAGPAKFPDRCRNTPTDGFSRRFVSCAQSRPQEGANHGKEASTQRWSSFWMITLGGAIWMQAQSQTQTYTCAHGIRRGNAAAGSAGEPGLRVPNPVIPKDPVTGARQLRGECSWDYVANLDGRQSALGKALFWDMQVGSDNKTACDTWSFPGRPGTAGPATSSPKAITAVDGSDPEPGTPGRVRIPSRLPGSAIWTTSRDRRASGGHVRRHINSKDRRWSRPPRSPTACSSVGGTNVRQVSRGGMRQA